MLESVVRSRVLEQTLRKAYLPYINGEKEITDVIINEFNLDIKKIQSIDSTFFPKSLA